MATKVTSVLKSNPTGGEEHHRSCGEGVFKMLVIGETGSGKTSFIKLLLNYAKNHDGKPFDLSEVSKMLQVQGHIETQSGKQWESDTTKCTKYIANFQNFRLGVIDTPGFGDTRPEYKETNTARIIAAVKGEKYINCVCLVANGTQSRLTSVAEEVIKEVTSILPRSIMSQVIVICTKTHNKRNLDFSPAMLKEFGITIPKQCLFYLDNPYSKWEKAQDLTSCSENSNSEEDDSDEEELDKELTSSFKKCHKKLDKIFKTIQKFSPTQTFIFGQLYEIVSEIERVIAEIETEYRNNREVESKLKELKEYVKENEAIVKTKLHYYSKIVVKTSKKKNLICHTDGCYRNCHLNCDCWFAFITLRACKMVEEGECQNCFHPLKDHKLTEYYFDQEEAELPIKDLPDYKNIEESVKSKEGLLVIEESHWKNSEKIIDDLTDRLKKALFKFQGIGTNCHFVKSTEKNVYEMRERISNITAYKHKVAITEILDNTMSIIRDPIAVVDHDIKFRWACGYLEINPENPDPTMVSKQFRLNAKNCHPDSGRQDEDSRKMFILLNHAKEFLATKGLKIPVPDFMSKAK